MTLEIVALSKRYGEQVALDSCSFEVVPGRLTGFFGQRRHRHTAAALSMNQRMKPPMQFGSLLGWRLPSRGPAHITDG